MAISPKFESLSSDLTMKQLLKATDEFETLVSWVQKLVETKNAPGLIVGISGTDSILAFMICAEAMKRSGKSHRLTGVHFGRDFADEAHSPEEMDRILSISPLYRWVPRTVFPWLKERYPEARMIVDDSFDFRNDHLRWAHLMSASQSEVEDRMMPDKTVGYWVVGTRNATEYALGTYSVSSMMASLQPIQGLWKSDVLKICEAFGVPTEALQQSRLVDCDCGRFDLAADHVEEIDDLLKSKSQGAEDCHHIEPGLKKKLRAFIEEQQAYSSFKKIIPYTPENTPYA